jgi:hypothetical protein
VTDDEKAVAALDDMFTQEREALGPLEVKCRACNAKPGEMCAGIVFASKNFTEPHAMRVQDAAPASDIEAAIKKRIARAEAEEVRRIQDRAVIAINALPPAEDVEHVQALLVAAIGLCDARGVDRRDLVDMFADLTKTLPPVAVR